MEIKTGIDILRKRRFLGSMKRGGKAFLERTFTPQELRQNTKEQLASIFCMKEAVMKALELPGNSWLMISTSRKENGKVVSSLLTQAIAGRIASLDTSISHDGEWIIGIAVCILR